MEATHIHDFLEKRFYRASQGAQACGDFKRLASSDMSNIKAAAFIADDSQFVFAMG